MTAERTDVVNDNNFIVDKHAKEPERMYLSIKAQCKNKNKNQERIFEVTLTGSIVHHRYLSLLSSILFFYQISKTIVGFQQINRR